MTNNAAYKCSQCDRETDRELLTAKKISFCEIGMNAKTLKSRIVDWLCPDCLVKDDVWNKPKYTTPGHVPSDDLVRLRARDAS